jgi:Flavodoxin domain
MKAVVIYESMYGNTHLIADAIADGLRAHGEVRVVPVAEARADVVEGADLVVVGGPTHAHGMSRAATRKGAVDAARKPGSDLVLEAAQISDDAGLREWFASIGQCSKFAAAFDTRVDLPAALTGRASKGIARKLRDSGSVLLLKPESFLVTKDTHLEPQEAARARAWGEQLGKAASDRIAQGSASRSGR